MEERPTLRDCYAAERTFLAWMRTGLALMGFGFLVARFAATGMQGIASWFGATFVMLGAVATLSSAFAYRRQLRDLSSCGVKQPLARLGLAVAAVLVVAAILMAAYLVMFVS